MPTIRLVFAIGMTIFTPLTERFHKKKKQITHRNRADSNQLQNVPFNNNISCGHRIAATQQDKTDNDRPDHSNEH